MILLYVGTAAAATGLAGEFTFALLRQIVAYAFMNSRCLLHSPLLPIHPW